MEIMGPKPLRQRGLIEKVGNKRYRVTEAGRQHASEIREPLGQLQQRLRPRSIGTCWRTSGDSYLQGRPPKFRKVAVTRSRSTTHVRLGHLSSKSARELRSRLAHFDAIVEAVRRAVVGQDFTLEHGGVSFSADERSSPYELSRFLAGNASTPSLAVILKREDERL